MAQPEIVSQQGSAQPIACDATAGSAPDAVAGWSWGRRTRAVRHLARRSS
jgi:hypothetical protein